MSISSISDQDWACDATRRVVTPTLSGLGLSLSAHSHSHSRVGVAQRPLDFTSHLKDLCFPSKPKADANGKPDLRSFRSNFEWILCVPSELSALQELKQQAKELRRNPSFVSCLRKGNNTHNLERCFEVWTPPSVLKIPIREFGQQHPQRSWQSSHHQSLKLKSDLRTLSQWWMPLASSRIKTL
ncbi:hypothetical protein CYMTET_29923 [Cymbomonas tetramitiformis]|uniref:Uncharacterized protein n=1 Tax=Cymbomonas tetramitiformis TaxID=36881 RepID=A0AAE0FJU3_9CHLO|nr:hypothetical protein CYMTET_29923 [Cymbomonas tetramitiformis]